MTTYKKESDWIEIEYVEDEHEEENDFKPSFWFENKRHFLDNFLRTHNNPWGGISDCPDYIHGYEADNYWNPIFIEIANSGDAVRVYRAEEV